MCARTVRHERDWRSRWGSKQVGSNRLWSLPLRQGSKLGFLVALEHAASVVAGSDLVTSDTAIVHLMEPLVSRLFDTILVSILPLLFSKI